MFDCVNAAFVDIRYFLTPNFLKVHVKQFFRKVTDRYSINKQPNSTSLPQNYHSL